MIDHIGIAVSHYERSKQFYQQALVPLGYQVVMEVAGFVGFGVADQGDAIPFWIHEDKKCVLPGMHIAFHAANRNQVNAFYHAALEANGIENGKPGIREIYHPNYYGAFILDPDGYNIEAVCHRPESR